MASELHLDPIVPVLAGLAALLLVAKLFGKAATRFGQPAVLGELLGGVLLGGLPLAGIQVLEFIKTSEVFEVLAGLGVILLLFEVGLENSVAELKKVGLSATLVALVGVFAPMALGFGLGAVLLPEHSFYSHLFLGATLCATSVGITARVLKDLKYLQSPEARIILGAAVIDDVLGLLVLAVVQGMIVAAASGGGEASLKLADVAFIAFKAFAFLALALAVGIRVAPRIFKLFARLKTEGMLLTLALILCFLMAYLSAAAGLAPIVGAFAAGLIIDRKGFAKFFGDQEPSLEDTIHPVSQFFVPLFFVTMGMKVDLRTLADPSVLGLGLALTVAAFLSKQVCGLFAFVKQGEARISRALVGFGMVPRGEVGLIFAMVGSTLVVGAEKIVDDRLYSALVIMIMATTMITPFTLKWSINKRKRSA